MSGAVLRALQRRAAAAGINLDVGEIPEYSAVGVGTQDPSRAATLLAHAIARGMDRIGPLRKVSRHLEGNENRAGIGSDLLSGAYELYVRNQEQVEKLLRDYVKNIQDKRTSRQADGSGNVVKGRFRTARDTQQPNPQEGTQ